MSATATIPRPRSDALRRAVYLPYKVARDTAVGGVRRVAAPTPRPPREGSMAAAAAWLCRTHDATGRQGSSQGYSLLTGWAPAFPETTGYVIGTLINYGKLVNDPRFGSRAREMGDWEIEIQQADGGIRQGLVGPDPAPSITFNTGMVLHGWVDLYRDTGEQRWLEAGERACRFLVDVQDTDGAWRGRHTYMGIPHTYKSRVAWAMLRFAEDTGDAGVRAAAIRHLDWVLSQQQQDGWFDCCNFKPGALPNTHAMAYTMRGLLESHAIVGDDAYLQAVVRLSEVLIRKQEVLGRLPAVFDRSWKPAVHYESLTGTVQLGNVWMRLYEITGDARYLNAGLKAVDHAAAHQTRSPWPAIDGALPGSFPVYGRYSPLRFPNWVTKFLLDALIRRREHTGQPAT